jgi:hypothetical protein
MSLILRYLTWCVIVLFSLAIPSLILFLQQKLLETRPTLAFLAVMQLVIGLDVLPESYLAEWAVTSPSKRKTFALFHFSVPFARTLTRSPAQTLRSAPCRILLHSAINQDHRRP